MLFDLDLNQSSRRVKLVGEHEPIPCAPPPSPNFGSRRKGVIPMPMLPLSKLIHSCEDLINRTSKISLGSKSSSPLHMKRKTSDTDDSSSSGGSSPGSSSPDLSCSVGKRSRSSLDFDSISLSVRLSSAPHRPGL